MMAFHPSYLVIRPAKGSSETFQVLPDTLKKICRHFKDDAELFQYMGVDKRSEPQDGFEFSYKVNFGNALNAQKVEFRPPALCR